MVRHFGYLQETNPISRLSRECDTSTCKHCGRVTMLKPPKDSHVIIRVRPCGGCSGLVCEECMAKGGCRPLELWLQEQEQRGRLRDALTPG